MEIINCKNKNKMIKYSQNQFDEDIVNYIIHAMAPLRTVDNHFFKNIFINSGVLKKNILNLISRRSLGRRIETRFEQNIEDVKITLEKVKYLCTTADVWSAKRSFMGVTVHWIDEESFGRKTAILACRRFRGAHTYDRIADILHNIYYKYNLDVNKVIATITDNGSNMVKAFKVFGVKLSYFGEMTHNHDTNEYDKKITTLLKMKMKKKSPRLQEIHNKVMNKCNVLWNAAGRPKSAEVIESILRHTLSRPGETRWNALFDSLSQINNIKEKSRELNRALGLKYNSFTISENNYIDEYLSLYCKAIRNSLLESIEKRFCNILNFNTIEAENAAIAAFSYPQFKNKWLNCIDSASHDKLLSIFKKAVVAELNSTKINEENFESQVDNYFDFFDFGPATQADRNTTVKSTSAEIEHSLLVADIIWFDGAPAHNAHIIRDHLIRVYEEKWFGTYGPIEWPVRSPDITPLDFFYGEI
ncbi:hypothetical protein QTP88_009567 [Uroleucon formosanum]